MPKAQDRGPGQASLTWPSPFPAGLRAVRMDKDSLGLVGIGNPSFCLPPALTYCFFFFPRKIINNALVELLNVRPSGAINMQHGLEKVQNLDF